MKTILLIIIFVLFCLLRCEAQMFNLGVGFEPYVVVTKHVNNIAVNIQVNALVKPIKQLEVDTRLGFAIPSELFAGGNIAVFIRVFPVNDFYLIIGHKWHWNISNDHNSGGIVGGLYKLPAIGLGYNYKNFYLESIFYKPNRKNLEYYYSYQDFKIKYPNDFNAVISLNFSYSWSLL